MKYLENFFFLSKTIWCNQDGGERRNNKFAFSIFGNSQDLVGLMGEGVEKHLKLYGVFNNIGHLWAWFILMAEEGVESFKDFSFMRDPIGEVGVIISIKVPLHSKLPLHLSAYTPTTFNDYVIPLHFSPPFISVQPCPFGFLARTLSLLRMYGCFILRFVSVLSEKRWKMLTSVFKVLFKHIRVVIFTLKIMQL